MQMHSKSGGHKVHPENSEKWIEDAGLHNPLPHLYNLQGKNQLKNCSLQEADIEENLNDNNAGKRQQAKIQTKSRKNK